MRQPKLNNILMTVEELAKYLKIKPDTIYKKVRRGELPAIKLGKLLRFPKELVDDWVVEQASKTMKDVRIAQKAVKAKVDEAIGEVKKTARTAGKVFDDLRHAPLNKKQEALNKGLKTLLKEVDEGIKKLTPKMPRARIKRHAEKAVKAVKRGKGKGKAASIKAAAAPASESSATHTGHTTH